MLQAAEQTRADLPAWYGVFCAFCALFVGIGLCRFAYSPLIPAVIEAGWFSPAQAAYLGAANLAGYLAGALGGGAVAARVGVPLAIRVTMLAAAATFVGSAYPLSMPWFTGWRFLSGVAGGALMVLAATAVLPAIPQRQRGLASGIIFSGVGLGIAASGTLVPLLLSAGLRETWLALGGLALLLTLASWHGWKPARKGAQPSASGSPATPRAGLRLKALYLEYALNAVGLVPHMVFFVDFIARGLGRGIAVGSGYWVLLGAGAICGPLIAGACADRLGFARTLRATFMLQAITVPAILLSAHPVVLSLSALVVGATIPGVVPLVLGRVHDLAPAAAAGRAWSRATVAFAIGQAVAAYGFSFIFAQTGGSYAPLFLIAALALAAALVIDIAAAAMSQIHRQGTPS